MPNDFHTHIDTTSTHTQTHAPAGLPPDNRGSKDTKGGGLVKGGVAHMSPKPQLVWGSWWGNEWAFYHRGIVSADVFFHRQTFALLSHKKWMSVWRIICQNRCIQSVWCLCFLSLNLRFIHAGSFLVKALGSHHHHHLWRKFFLPFLTPL